MIQSNSAVCALQGQAASDKTQQAAVTAQDQASKATDQAGSKASELTHEAGKKGEQAKQSMK